MRIVIKKNDINKRLYDLIEYLITFLFVIFPGCIWTSRIGGIFQDYLTELLVLCYGAIILWAAPYLKREIKLTGLQVVFFFVSIASLLFVLVNSLDNLLFTLLRVVIPMICGLAIAAVVPKEKISELFDKYINIMTLMSVVSLFFWLFGSVLKMVPITGVTRFTWGSVLHTANSYYGIYYEPDWMRSSLLGISIYRNCGIYTEAPMYAFSLCMAYGFLGMKSAYNKRVKLLLMLTILSTISTTGIIFVLLFEMINIVTRKAKNRIEIIIKSIGYIFICIIVIGIAYDLIMQKLATGSGSIRSDHMMACLEVFIDTFPLGAGLGNADAVTRVMRYKQGISVGLPYVFALGGLGTMLIVVVPVCYGLINSLKIKNWKKFAFIICFFWSMFCTIVQFISPIPWIVLCCLIRKDSFA